MVVKLSDSEKDGSTRVSASFTVNEDSNGAALTLKVKTRKSGISGRGRGVAQAILIDTSGKPCFSIKETATVGAELDGSASKERSESVYLRAAFMGKVIGWAFKCDADNNNGIADTLEGILQNPVGFAEKVIRDPLNTIKDIAVGNEVELDSGWLFFRRK